METKTFQVRIDTVKEAYQSFYDHAWAKRIRKMALGTPLHESCSNLFWAWKGIARTAFLPWLMINNMAGFAESMDRMEIRKDHMLQLVDYLRGELFQRLSDTSTKLEVCRALEQVKKGLKDKQYPSMAGTFDENAAWEEFLKVKDFQLSLVWSQRISFSALYHAYEDFMTSCVGIAKRDPDYRFWKFATFKTHFAAEFNDPLTSTCLGDFVNTARMVRNSLAHNGGREDSELNATTHQYAIEEDVIQITATDVRILYHSLKDNVAALVTHAVTLPQFQSTEH